MRYVANGTSTTTAWPQEQGMPFFTGVMVGLPEYLASATRKSGLKDSGVFDPGTCSFP